MESYNSVHPGRQASSRLTLHAVETIWLHSSSTMAHAELTLLLVFGKPYNANEYLLTTRSELQSFVLPQERRARYIWQLTKNLTRL